MDTINLKKKLSSYVSSTGRIKNVSDELLYDLLKTWEEWSGTARDFYHAIGFSHRQMAKLIGKAKQLQRNGHFGNPDFKEIQLATTITHASLSPTEHVGVEIVWDNGKLIRFSQVETLIEFLKKAA